MDFLKKKFSRVGYTLCHYRVTVIPLTLEMTIDQPGEVWVQFKRGRHVETTARYTVEAKSGYGRQNVTVNFNEGEALIRVSDFYKGKDGSLQDKEGKFQIMFQGNDYVHPVKVCTAFFNMSLFVNRGV